MTRGGLPTPATQDISDQPTWDSSPSNLAAFNEDLLPWLMLQSSQYRLLIEKGIVVVREHTAVTSPTHARLIITDKYPAHDGRKPSPLTVPDSEELAIAAHVLRGIHPILQGETPPTR